MKRYIRLYKRLLANAASREMMFRAHFVIDLAMNLMWFAISLVFIEILFGHTDAIGSWTKSEMYLLVAVWWIFDRVSSFGWSNMESISRSVQRGRLDMLFTKPVDAQFLVTVGMPKIRPLVEILSFAIVFAYLFVTKLDLQISLRHLPLFVVALVCAFVIDYAIRLMLNTLAFWFVMVDNVNELWKGMQNFAQYPMTIFPRALRFVFFSFIPIGLFTYVPTLALLGKNQLPLIVLSLAAAVFFFLSARMFWLFAVKRYSSASS